VFQKELYAGISFAAGLLYVGLQHTGLDHNAVTMITLCSGFVARLLAMHFELGLPVFNYTQSEES
ncbi:MAG: trimeric intracellular cation channel family protein, partial [Plesiomonas shigelloides]